MHLYSSSETISPNRLDPIIQNVKCARSERGIIRSRENDVKPSLQTDIPSFEHLLTLTQIRHCIIQFSVIIGLLKTKYCFVVLYSKL